MSIPTDILLCNRCSPGDVLVLTAAVRDLHLAYPGQYHTGVDTRCPDLWLNSPYLSHVDPVRPGIFRVYCSYPPLLDRCNGQSRHYVESMHGVIAKAIGREVPLTRFAPDLHLSRQEREAPPLGVKMPYWLVVAGGKRDLTTKWWPAKHYQQVVDALRGRVRFVQAGAARDHHPPLQGVVNLVGRTTLRQFLCFVYHAEGVVCPVTFAMHAAAAFDKHCVVIAGGRESPHWETYPGHQFLHTVGHLPCCATGGCWKARVVPLGDGDRDGDMNLCRLPAEVDGRPVATCMALIEPRDVVRAVERYLDGRRYSPGVRKGARPVLSESNAVQMMDTAIAALPPYLGGYEGRGIVIPAGGTKYFPCAWVCIRMLREVGCELPIEMWHLGPQEVTPKIRDLVEPLGVRCVNAWDLRRTHPARTLNGWELKPYSILYSRFREVLLLDADNFPLMDPAFLFDADPYRKHGAVFWPDYGRLPSAHPAWRLTGVTYQDEPAFESGQMVVDKQRCWRPLSLAMWMNEHSDFWYRHLHGDKDTYHLAWRKLGPDYAMPARPIQPLPGTMCQHDFEGLRIFQHRNTAKWTLTGRNPRVPGFLHEDKALVFLGDLRRRWTPGPPCRYRDGTAGEEQRRLARDLCGGRWLYRRVGHGERPMTFGLDGTVREGAAGRERTWNFQGSGGSYQLVIAGEGSVTCRLSPDGRGGWRGAWEVCERMPVELVPADRADVDARRHRLQLTIIR